MLQWLTENAATIIVSLVLIAVVAGIIAVIYKDKKKGRSSCGCNCGTCPMGGSCHKH